MATKKEDKDVEMKEVEVVKDDKDKSEEPEVPVDPKVLALNALHANIQLIAKTVAKKQKQHMLKVVRSFHGTRKAMRVDNLSAIIAQYAPDSAKYLPLDKIPAEMEEEKEEKVEEVEEKKEEKKEEKTEEKTEEKGKKAKKDQKEEEKKEEEKFDADIPEVKVYVDLLITAFLLDKKLYQEAAECVTATFESLQSQNRRSLDLLSDKVYSLYSLSYERLGKLADCRSNLLFAHRTACLHHNEPGQAALTVCILRNFLHYNLYNQADKFCRNTAFPESRSNNLHARYLYYTGKINSVQLHYSDAFKEISQAIRKAPQAGALGFRQKANKLLIIVQLLMGEIPERTVFRQKGLERSLLPYFQLTQAVRVGDLPAFGKVVKEHEASFVKDRVFSLITRLHHNVIKTGLRRINLSYSRISIADICTKLNLPSAEDAEYIVAKAIHDGVIEAVIDYKEHFLFSKENTDIYSTQEPSLAFHRRTQFCMEIYNESRKAMRYPADAHKPKKGPGLGEDDEKKGEDAEEKLEEELLDEDDEI